MAFLDRLLGAPTLDKLARDVTRELHELGAQELSVDLALREMTFRLHGGEMKLYLGNVLHDLRRSRRGARPALLKRFLDGMLAPERLLDIVQNFTLFDESKTGATRKVVARNHQVLGVNRAVVSVVWQEELKRDFPPSTACGTG